MRSLLAVVRQLRRSHSPT